MFKGIFVIYKIIHSGPIINFLVTNWVKIFQNIISDIYAYMKYLINSNSKYIRIT
jgi:hypothetical protein